MAKTLTMPVNSNQKQDEKNTWIYNAGCAVCSGVDTFRVKTLIK